MVWGLSTAAFADGKLFPKAVYAPVEIPDQRALIHYADGVQTLVVETSFIGEGNDFAWVVPLPAAPRIEAVSAGVFRTLEHQFQPRVILSVTRWWLGIIALWVLLGLATLAVCQRRYAPGVLFFLMAGALGAILWMMFMPALSKARMGASAATTVKILDRQQAGIFETTTISSSDPEALLEWLRENGFGIEPEVEPVVADYAQERWVFVAAKINRQEEPSMNSAVHPLAFTFQTEKPVYPLRLTGVGNGACLIDLYVFGPGRAQVRGFKVKHCERPVYNQAGVGPQFTSRQLRIRHKEISRLVQDAPVATKLTGHLTAREMEKDAYISWKPFRSTQAALYTRDAAADAGVNIGAMLAMFGCGGLVLAGRRFAWSKRMFLGGHVLLLSAGAIAAGLFFVTVPKIDRELLRSFRASTFQAERLERLGEILGEILEVELKHERAQFAAQLNTFERAHELFLDYQVWNMFTAERIRLEASPGNYILREVSSGLELVWHDADGAEALLSQVRLEDDTVP
jgi:hypothetical protein